MCEDKFSHVAVQFLDTDEDSVFAVVVNLYLTVHTDGQTCLSNGVNQE